MQARFKDQLEIQALLENAGWKLRKNHVKDSASMQAELPVALKTANLDKRAFVPITNPRLLKCLVFFFISSLSLNHVHLSFLFLLFPFSPFCPQYHPLMCANTLFRWLRLTLGRMRIEKCRILSSAKVQGQSCLQGST